MPGLRQLATLPLCRQNKTAAPPPNPTLAHIAWKEGQECRTLSAQQHQEQPCCARAGHSPVSQPPAATVPLPPEGGTVPPLCPRCAPTPRTRSSSEQSLEIWNTTLARISASEKTAGNTRYCKHGARHGTTANAERSRCHNFVLRQGCRSEKECSSLPPSPTPSQLHQLVPHCVWPQGTHPFPVAPAPVRCPKAQPAEYLLLMRYGSSPSAAPSFLARSA